jgi:hypothetical protein
MGLKFSSGLRNALMGPAMLQGTSLAYVDGGGGSDTITDSENRFLLAGFRVGDTISSAGSTTGANNLSTVTLTGVAAGTLTFATATVDTAEAFVANTRVYADTADASGDFATIMAGGVIHIYSGSQPTDADQSEGTGTLLLEITLSGGAFTPESSIGAADNANGLTLGPTYQGQISKGAHETWQGTGVAAGTASWFRWYDQYETTGASTNARRIDGDIGTSNSVMILSSLSITVGKTVTVDSFAFTQPAS